MHRSGLGAVADFAIDEDGEQKAEQRVEAHEANEREEAVAGGDGV